LSPARHPVRIAPSLLAADFARLADEIGRIEAGGADWLHCDVMDGHFVRNLTIGPPVVAAIKRVATRPLDVHVMIDDPWAYADPFLDAGADGYTFHAEVAGRGDASALIERVRARGARAGMAINPDAGVELLAPFLGQLDLVLVMSVFAGFGGQRFMPEVLAKVRALREEHGFTGLIEMDGGIGPDTIAACAAAGTDVFVAGTAIFGAADAKGRIAALRAAAERARPA
jgi:ribulose-phosphate 3-epimerase